MFNRQEATFTANYNGVNVLVTVVVSGDKLSAHSDGTLGQGFAEGAIPSLSDVTETFDNVIGSVAAAFHELEHLEEQRASATDPLAGYFPVADLVGF